VPGAIAGWAAMATPALLIIPLVHFVGMKMDQPRIKLLAAVIPLARDALTDPVTIGIVVATVVLLLTTELDTLWMILGAATIALAPLLLHL
jgi:chromate transporter